MSPVQIMSSGLRPTNHNKNLTGQGACLWFVDLYLFAEIYLTTLSELRCF